MEPLHLFDVLRAFEVDVDTGGGADFVEYLYRVAAWQLWDPGERLPTGKIAEQMAKQLHIPLRVFYGRMRWAIRPLIEAAPDILAAFGLEPKGRTVGKMAECFAAARLDFLRGSRQFQDC